MEAILTMYQDEKNMPAVPSRNSQTPLVESVSQLCSPQTANCSQTEARWELDPGKKTKGQTEAAFPSLASWLLLLQPQAPGPLTPGP